MNVCVCMRVWVLLLWLIILLVILIIIIHAGEMMKTKTERNVLIVVVIIWQIVNITTRASFVCCFACIKYNNITM